MVVIPVVVAAVDFAVYLAAVVVVIGVIEAVAVVDMAIAVAVVVAVVGGCEVAVNRHYYFAD